MIIKLLLELLYLVFSLLTAAINIPGMPDGVTLVLATALDYITSGVGIVGQFFDLNYLFSLFSIIIMVDAGMLIYKLVMWIIRKIPVIDVE